MIKKKKCSKCNRQLELSEFTRAKWGKNGLNSRCRRCAKKYVGKHRKVMNKYSRKYRQSKKGKETQRKYYQEHKEELVEYNKKYRNKHPERKKASNKLNNAIKKGKIKRMPCMVCGKPQTEGHHQDYNKPLDVQWLCRLHHRRLHFYKEGESIV